MPGLTGFPARCSGLLRRTGLARVSLRLVVKGEDAAATALRFGRANAAVYSATAALDRIFSLRVERIEIIPGFSAEQEEYSCSGEIRLFPLAVLIAALQLGFWTLIALIRSAGGRDTHENENRRRSPSDERKSAMENKHPISEILEESLTKLKQLVDVDTIIGKPITAPDGTIIIPISKVSFGFATGGSELPTSKPSMPFGGGSGGGVTIAPLAFLVIANGNVQLLQMQTADNTADRW